MQSSVFTIPNGKFVLKNGLNKKGEKGIYLLYYINNVRVYASSKVFVKPGDWDESNQKVKTKNLNHEAKNSRLVQFRKDVEKLIYEYGKPLDAQKLRDLLSGKIKTKAAVEEEKQSSDFIQYANDYIERCYKLGKLAYSTYANDLHSIDMFRRYILEKTGEDSLPLKEITILTIDEYKEYCLEKKNKKQSINKKLKPLIKTIAYASRSRLIDAVLANEICEIGYFVLKDRKYESEVDEGEVRYLDKCQLQELVNMYNKVKYSRTREFIDIFMFSFHACGLRFSDLLTLEWSHIDWENKKRKKV